jgi:hypothetical protein
VTAQGSQRVRVVGQKREDASQERQSPERQGPDIGEDRSVVDIGVRRRHSNEGTAEAEEVNKRRRMEEVEGMEKIRQVRER